jgi:hypothetical protein
MWMVTGALRLLSTSWTSGCSRGQAPSIVSVRFAYAFRSKLYPIAQTALGPAAAAPVRKGFEKVGVVSRVHEVPFQRRMRGAPVDWPTAMTADGDNATTSLS